MNLKKGIVLSIFCFVLTLSASAQEYEGGHTTANITYYNAPIYKILDSRSSYVVLYGKYGAKIGTVTIPKKWAKWQKDTPRKLTIRKCPNKINPYITIVKAAIIPAILYFTGIFITVHLEAKKLRLKGLPKDQLPKFLPLFLKKGYMILPLIIIILFLCLGKTAVYAALMGIIACLAVGLLISLIDIASGRKPTFTSKDIVDVMCAAARNIISVAIACGMAGIIIGIVTLTGLGLKLGAGLVTLAHGKLFLTLLFTMLASIILGMGAPTTANYLITSTITATAIIQLGIEPLAAHMFAFYFGIIADVTPPVALAAIAGAAIAKSKPMVTAVNATKLAIGAFLIPYVFVYNPQMLMIGGTFTSILTIIVTALIGMFGISVALEGYAFKNTSIVERILFAIAGLACVIPESKTDIIGLIIMAILVSYQLISKKLLAKKAQQ